MQFKNPEFLWALFFLLIPFIIHLFRFRRFKTEFFTNVKFLKEIDQKSRKRSQLKKWLVLTLRVGILGALILAFAQPYRSHTDTSLLPQETIIYIDNSLSMQQKGERGELLKEALQEVAQFVPEDRRITVLTNNEVYRENTLGKQKNDLLKIDYSTASDDFKTILLRAENLYSGEESKKRQLIAISDFQRKNFETGLTLDSTFQLHFIQLKARSTPNFSIDSAKVENADAETTYLTAFLSSSQKVNQRLTVDLYNENELYAKNSTQFKDTTRSEIRFSVPRDQEIAEGRLKIDDHQLRYDNTYYFSLQQNQQIKVVAVSDHREDQIFIKKIFNGNAFDLDLQLLRTLNYTRFEGADFIILNGLQQFPAGITNSLKNHLADGGSIAIIPGDKADLKNYNQVLLELGLGAFERFRTQEAKISQINFAHPLYAGVFENRVENFQYPEVKGFYPYKKGDRILGLNNGTAFLSEQDHIYLFHTPLNKEMTNFKQSPLIVPTFYNMGLQSSKRPQLAYVIGSHQKVDVKTALQRDDVIHLKRGEEDMIPPQDRFNAKVELDISNHPDKAGLYAVQVQGAELGKLAFNASRAESDLRFRDFKAEQSVRLSSDLKQLMKEEEYKQNEDSYWKWFVTFALLFVLGEFLLLKYLK